MSFFSDVFSGFGLIPTNISDPSGGTLFGSSALFDIFAPPTVKLFNYGEEQARKQQEEVAATAFASLSNADTVIQNQSPLQERATIKIGTGSGSLLGSLGLIVEPTTGRGSSVGLNVPTNTSGLGFGTSQTGVTR